MANISDHLTMANLAPFGTCRSLGFPATASATAAAQGVLTPMPCVHNTPFPWMGGKMDHMVQGQPALLKSSKCQCMWGGTISLITDGQMPTGPANTNKGFSGSFFIEKLKKLLNEIAELFSDSELFDTSDASNQNNQLLVSNNPSPELHKHMLELMFGIPRNIDKLQSLPPEWKSAIKDVYNSSAAAAEAIKKGEREENGENSLYSNIEHVYSIYMFALDDDARKYGYQNLSPMMPYDVFKIEKEISGGMPPKHMPKKEFWDSFDRFVPLRTNVGNNSAYSDKYGYVKIPMNNDKVKERLTNSDWKQTALFYHEFGHAYDHSHRWSYDRSDSNSDYKDFKAELDKFQSNASTYKKNLNDYLDNKMIKSMENIENNSGNNTNNDLLSRDEREKLMALAGCLQAVGQDNYEPSWIGGHKKSYYVNNDGTINEENQMAEFIAHMSENYWEGNDLFEQLAPDAYKSMRELMEKKMKKKD